MDLMPCEVHILAEDTFLAIVLSLGIILSMLMIFLIRALCYACGKLKITPQEPTPISHSTNSDKAGSNGFLLFSLEIWSSYA